MSVTVVVGAQWGDEGKGRIIDLLAQEADLVVRYNGGANAGHTVVNELGTFKMHLMPSGIFSPSAVSIIGNGVLMDLQVLVEELAHVHEAGIQTRERLFASPRCHVVMPYHKVLDGLYEEAKGPASTGTTRRGIGPAFADKVSYNGIRLADFADEQVLRARLDVQLRIKNRVLAALGADEMTAEDVLDAYLPLYEQVAPYIVEPYPLIHEAVSADRAVLCEGAQGAMLDVDWSSYPYCTASSPLASNVTGGAGIPPTAIDRVVAVVKAYSTRVGDGPLPTELADETGDRLREAGGEFGTTTGRPRRCGWLDAEIVRFSCQLNGATELAITRLDVLDGFESLSVATSYRRDGRATCYTECTTIGLEQCRPVYEGLPGWQQPTGDCRAWEDLPAAAQQYVQRIEQLVGLPATFISVGPEREQMVRREAQTQPC